MDIDIVFPDHVFITPRGELKCKDKTEIDINEYTINIISIDGVDYSFTYLNEKSGNKGGNSIILKLYETQNLNVIDGLPNYDIPDKILKLNKRFKEKFSSKKSDRFQNEVNALKKCLENSLANILKIYDYGTARISGKLHSFYTMEVAMQDLKSFIEENHYKLDLESKISLCISLARGLEDLQSLDVYHRDLKPDNIFIMEDNNWKLGDLGLVGADKERTFIVNLDKESEFIGPRGWISPEVMNKYLTEGKGFLYSYDCKIDHQSDIYQLGKIFWYIFQFNSPIGYLNLSDFEVKNSNIFYLIRSMLYYSKLKRVQNISEVISILKKIEQNVIKIKSLSN